MTKTIRLLIVTLAFWWEVRLPYWGKILAGAIYGGILGYHTKVAEGGWGWFLLGLVGYIVLITCFTAIVEREVAYHLANRRTELRIRPELN